jgi:hypothetical protein
MSAGSWWRPPSEPSPISLTRTVRGPCWRRVADGFRPRWPRLAQLLDDAEDDVVASVVPARPVGCLAGVPGRLKLAAAEVCDDDLQRLADAFEAKRGSDWQFIVRDGAFVDTSVAMTHGAVEGQAHVFQLVPTTAFAFSKRAAMARRAGAGRLLIAVQRR